MIVDKVISFTEAQERERALLDAARTLKSYETLALVWRTQKAIIVPRGLPSRARYEMAVDAMSLLGYPVFERDTGGDLTPQSPGVVNLSLVHRLDGANASIAEAYGRLTAPVVAFLQETFGVEADVGAVPGAFCDGAYNIASGGKKLGGTAQRWKLLGGEGADRKVAVLSHVAILARVDLRADISALNAFYEAMGEDRRIVLDRHVTLVELAGSERIEPQHVAASLGAFIAARI